MRSKLVGLAGLTGLFTFLAVELYAPAAAEACGVKLTVKPTAPRKAVARTSNPSQVLLVGNHPKRLERDLTVAGHNVESVSSPESGKRETYEVVIVDSNENASAARARYPKSAVIVRSGDVGADLKSVEAKVVRKPVAADEDRDVVAARAVRTPIAAGPDRKDREKLAAKEPAEETPAPTPAAATPPAPAPTPAPEPAPKPEKVAAATTSRSETPAPKPEKPAKVAATSAALHEEVYFGLGKSAAPGTSRALAKSVKWLTANPDVNVVIEGHADPTGTPEGNMTLSQARADAVKEFLVSSGVDASRIDVQAFGDTKLKYGRKDGRNRRASIAAKKE